MPDPTRDRHTQAQKIELIDEPLLRAEAEARNVLLQFPVKNAQQVDLLGVFVLLK